MKVISEPGKNAIDRILQLIEEAEERRAPIERFLDRFSRYYTPAIMLLAVAVIWCRRCCSHSRGIPDSSRPDAAADRLPMRIGDLDPGGVRPGWRLPRGAVR